MACVFCFVFVFLVGGGRRHNYINNKYIKKRRKVTTAYLYEILTQLLLCSVYGETTVFKEHVALFSRTKLFDLCTVTKYKTDCFGPSIGHEGQPRHDLMVARGAGHLRNVERS